MRVIAGTLKGRRLDRPTWSGLRPTSDQLKETIFNILASAVEGATVLDGFAGSGALGIEAISRGARHVTFVERDPRAQALITRNLARCGIETGYTVIRASMTRALERLPAAPAFTPFDIVLLDPPYDVDAEAALAGADALLASNGVLVLEHARKQPTPIAASRLVRVREVKAGDSALAIYALRP
jgi:16S rRNA (guanine(966)-N(2))-methyltransferase RsmD